MNKYFTSFMGAVIAFGLSITVQAQSITKTIEGFAHPESVVESGNYLYVGNVGNELQPSAKDGDGFISKVNVSTGKVEQLHFLPNGDATLNAPKGLTIADNTLYLADINRVMGFDLDSGKMVFELNIPEASFLNDVVAGDSQTLYVSGTSLGKIARINIPKQSYEFLDIPMIKGANGLDLSTDKTTLYCVGFGADNQPNGRITEIELDPLKAKTIGNYQGLLDGAQLYNGKLYFSDWKSENKGIINILDLQSNHVSMLDLSQTIGGPADFYLDQNSSILYVPSMLESKIYVIKL
ncbi:MAG TPA: hypothetical protein VJ964_10035 [Balneolaceae bacterium]|nr:hypothetical protein [Balneolaceae bacterium]